MALILKLQQLWSLFSPGKYSLASIVLCLIGVGILEFVSFSLVQNFFSNNLAENSLFQLISGWFGLQLGDSLNNGTYLVAVLFLASLIIRNLIAVMLNWIIFDFAQEQRVLKRFEIVQSLLTNAAFGVKRTQKGELIHIVQSLTAQFSRVIVNLLKLCADTVILTSIFLFFAINYPIWILLVFPGGVLLVLGYDFLFKRRLLRNGAESNVLSARIMAMVSEAAEGWRGLGCSEKYVGFLASFRSKNASFRTIQAVNSLIKNSFRNYLELGVCLFFLTLIALIDIDVLMNAMSLEIVSVLSLAFFRLVPLMTASAGSFTQLRESFDSIDRLINIMKNELGDDRKNARKRQSEINFEYREPVSYTLAAIDLNFQGFKNGNASFKLSFDVSIGEIMALIGSSGSGKSSALEILAGLRRFDSGYLFLNGKPLAKSEHSKLRGLVSFCEQFPVAFTDTVAFNVAMRQQLSDDERCRIESMLETFGLGNWVKSLPLGLDTTLGGQEAGLSGGQLKRLGLVRAFFTRSPIVILDEPTAGLDAENEVRALKAIKQFSEQSIIILSTHSPSVQKISNHVISLGADNYAISRKKA